MFKILRVQSSKKAWLYATIALPLHGYVTPQICHLKWIYYRPTAPFVLNEGVWHWYKPKKSDPDKLSKQNDHKGGIKACLYKEQLGMGYRQRFSGIYSDEVNDKRYASRCLNIAWSKCNIHILV